MTTRARRRYGGGARKSAGILPALRRRYGGAEATPPWGVKIEWRV